MRVVALGDAHLGRSYLNVVTPEHVNQRELDFEVSFARAVELALAQQPDLVVWLGDVFDHPRPTYRSYTRAQRALRQIRAHGVPFVAISGNHDTPRLPGTGSPYTALADAFPELHFATRLTYEHFDVAGIRVHAVPQMLTVDATLQALDDAAANRSLDLPNLLLTHPRIPQVQPRYADINEVEVDAARLQSDFVLLGHYHFHTTVRDGVWYAGSTDTFTFADDPQLAKGVLVLDTASGQVEHVPLDGQRPLVTLPEVDALGRSHQEIEAGLLQGIAGAPPGAVARVFITGADPEAWRLVDIEAVRAAVNDRGLLHLKPEVSFIGVSTEVDPAALDLASMPARWDRYLENQDLLGLDRDRIRQLGRDYLSHAVEDLP